MEIIASKKVEWQGTVYDSQLEADWAATLESWSIAVRHHPGRLSLADGGWWEPDFLALPRGRAGEEILIEVKGPHGDRLWKASEAAQRFDLPVLILRAGLVPADSAVESAGAVWHGTELWGEEWVVDFDSEGLGAFTRTPRFKESVRVSAERCIVRPEATGLGMRKALTREARHG